jgi:hypothetical protein
MAIQREHTFRRSVVQCILVSGGYHANQRSGSSLYWTLERVASMQLKSHTKKILRSKTSEAAYRKRRGAYTILRDDQPFCTDKRNSTKEEKAEDELIFLRFDFASKNNLNQIYLDSDDDDDEGTNDTDEYF